MTNFSHNACKVRYESLQDGNAKPTPESIADPDERILERIEARRKRELKIAEETAYLRSSITSETAQAAVADLVKANRKGNAWNSKTKPYN